MIIDLVFVVVLLLALLHGYRHGLIVGFFSLVAIIVGLAAAIKLSAIVSVWLGNSVNISDQWLPIISFAVVFIAVVLLIRLGARALESVVKTVMLGWLNKIGGMIFFAAIYIIIFSVVLFYLEKMNLIQPSVTHRSVTYSFIQPWGPKVMDAFGSLLPIFRNMFHDLEEFFSKASPSKP
ncbi:MAG TPA: CvpA family protein [Chitinophagaceae bacterium]|nr:CvpA family protein [Chitinophagaceae bacterium]